MAKIWVSILLSILLPLTAFADGMSSGGGLSSRSGWSVSSGNVSTSLTAANVGVGTSIPGAKLEVDGNVYINNNPAILYMKKPNGTCAEMTVDNNNLLNVFNVPCPVPYLGQFATRTAVQTAILSSATATKIIAKTRHYARSTINGFKIGYPNWYIDQGTQQETGSGGTATITAAIEYPIGGTITQVKWSGSSNVTVNNLTQSALSDTINLVIKDGDPFIVRTYFTSPGGVLIYCDTGNQQDTANGEEFRYSTGTLADQTMVAGTYSGGTSNSNYNYGPDVIVAMITKPSVLFVGDSRVQGIHDTYAGNSSTDKGELGRTVGPSFGYINTALPGQITGSWLVFNTLQVALAQYCTIVIDQLGVNDIGSSGISAATLLNTRQAAVEAFFPGKKFYLTTIPPFTTSSDSWATVGNQTIHTPASGVISQYNDLLRAGGIAFMTGYFEFADIAESARDSGKWITNGSANTYTDDGLHETQAMNLLYLTNGAVDPVKILSQ